MVYQLGRRAGVPPQPNGCNTGSASAVETGDRIAYETADSLGSAVLVRACGVFVALLHDLPKIVIADVDHQPPKPAARPVRR